MIIRGKVHIEKKIKSPIGYFGSQTGMRLLGNEPLDSKGRIIKTVSLREFLLCPKTSLKR